MNLKTHKYDSIILHQHAFMATLIKKKKIAYNNTMNRSVFSPAVPLKN